MLFALLLLLPRCTMLAQSPYAGSVLWKVSGNGLAAPSYLYATIPTSNPKALQLSDSVQMALDSAQLFVAELQWDTINLATPSWLMGDTKDYSLDKYLDKPTFAALEHILEKDYHLKYFGNLKSFKPIYLYLGLIRDTGEVLQPDVAGNLKNLASQKGKPMTGLLDPIKIARELDSISIKEQTDLLKAAIKAKQTATRKGADLMKDYLAGDLDKVLQFQRKHDYPDKLFKLLFRLHNQQLANTIDGMVQQQTLFVTLEIPHLVGDNGVIDLLRKKGYTVTPVK